MSLFRIVEAWAFGKSRIPPLGWKNRDSGASAPVRSYVRREPQSDRRNAANYKNLASGTTVLPLRDTPISAKNSRYLLLYEGRRMPLCWLRNMHSRAL